MPIYDIFTKTITERSYSMPLTLPVDMGGATNRLTDKMIRTGATEGTLNLVEAQIVNSAEESEEEITCIMRDGIQIWPLPRKTMIEPAPIKNFVPSNLPDDEE